MGLRPNAGLTMSRYARAMESDRMELTDKQTLATALHQALVRGDLVQNAQIPIVAELIGSSHAVFVSEEIAARVRAMIDCLAAEIEEICQCVSPGDAKDCEGGEDFDELSACPSLLKHCLACAFEGELALRLEGSIGLDPVLSPLLQELVASERGETAELGMHAVTAQARFIQSYRRMSLSLGEIPADILHDMLGRWEAVARKSRPEGVAEKVVEEVKSHYSEASSRAGLLARLFKALGKAAGPSLLLEHAGLGLFASALALRSGQTRDTTMLSMQAGQEARLALAMVSAGLREEQLVHQLGYFCAASFLPHGILGLDRQSARTILDTGMASEPG